ncbi:MAG: hypothetical protein ACI9SE_004857 [Neolewinella sp.]
MTTRLAPDPRKAMRQNSTTQECVELAPTELRHVAFVRGQLRLRRSPLGLHDPIQDRVLWLPPLPDRLVPHMVNRGQQSIAVARTTPAGSGTSRGMRVNNGTRSVNHARELSERLGRILMAWRPAHRRRGTHRHSLRHAAPRTSHAVAPAAAPPSQNHKRPAQLRAGRCRSAS